MSSEMRELGQPRIDLSSTSSTMDEIRNRQLVAPEGLTVVALTQTSGRGRGDHQWQDVPGNSLLFSTLLRPGVPFDRFQLFPIAAGLAAAEAIDEELAIRVQLKWPNDLFIANRKFGGVLVTSRVHAGLVESAILGIGINLFSIPPNHDVMATSLSLHTSRPISRDSLLDSILKRLGQVYSHVLFEDATELVARWNDRCLWRGEIVSVETSSGFQVGRLRGIDESGALKIEQDSGATTAVALGELTRGVKPLINAAEM